MTPVELAADSLLRLDGRKPREFADMVGAPAPAAEEYARAYHAAVNVGVNERLSLQRFCLRKDFMGQRWRWYVVPLADRGWDFASLVEA